MFNEGEPLPWLGLLSFLSQASPDCMYASGKPSDMISLQRFLLFIGKTWISCDLRICQVGIVSNDYAEKGLEVRRSMSRRAVS